MNRVDGAPGLFTACRTGTSHYRFPKSAQTRQSIIWPKGDPVRRPRLTVFEGIVQQIIQELTQQKLLDAHGGKGAGGALAFHVKIRDTELLVRAARVSFFHCVFVQESHSQFLVDSALDRFRRVAAQDNVRSVSLVSEL